jgi:hypothetical protein
MAIKVGTTVVTPSGKTAVVKAYVQLRTGLRGRPYPVVLVQEKNRKGHFVPGTYACLVRDVKAASVAA